MLTRILVPILFLWPAASAAADLPYSAPPPVVPIVTPIVIGAARIIDYMVIQPAGMMLAPIVRVPRDLYVKPRPYRHSAVRQ